MSNWKHVFLTLTEVSPCFFLSCKANARVKLAKTGHGPHSSKLVVICVVLLLFVLFYVLFMCKCVLYYRHRVTTQLQLTNISYHIKKSLIWWQFTESPCITDNKNIFCQYCTKETCTIHYCVAIISMVWTPETSIINALNTELNSICYLLALLGAHHFLHVSRIRVKLLTFRRLMSYIYIWRTHSWCF